MLDENGLNGRVLPCAVYAAESAALGESGSRAQSAGGFEVFAGYCERVCLTTPSSFVFATLHCLRNATSNGVRGVAQSGVSGPGLDRDAGLKRELAVDERDV